MALLEIKDVTYSYRSRGEAHQVLRGVSASFAEGQTYAIVGKSGSGKSTLLSLMAGLDVPLSGNILYEGKSTSAMDRNAYRRSKVGIIYQDYSLFPLLTVLENIMYPLNLNGVTGAQARRTAEELAERVQLPKSLFHRYPGRISGGEQQRVAIARALTMNRRLLLADEPTGNLDSENSSHVMGLLKDLAHEDGCCVILVTHDLGVMDEADEIFQIKDGLIEKRARAVP